MPIPPDVERALALGGENGRRIAACDWEHHPLGPIEQWSPTVRTLVATTLSSRFPIVLWLGSELFVLYNDAYIPMLGGKHPDALARPGKDVWWEIWDVIGPMLESVMRSGIATWSDDELLMVFRDGYREEGYFTFTYSPIVEADGSIAGVFCAVNETTQRVLSERRLAALHDVAAAVADQPSIDAVTEAALASVAAHQADVRCMAVYLRTDDGAQLRGWTPNLDHVASDAACLDAWGDIDEDATTATFVDRIPGALLPNSEGDELPPSRAFVLPLLDAATDSAMGWIVVGLNPHRIFDEPYRTFCALLAGQVAIAFTNASAHEHERRRAEALAELDRAKTAFFSNVSHEFRTPLTLMLGPIAEMAATITDVTMREQLETVDRNSRRLLRLVNSLLDFARIEAGRTTAMFVETNIGAFTADLAGAFRAACERAGLDLVVRCDPVVAYVDRTMWETIVLNLISNAFKFTFAGAITVQAASTADGDALVTVADTGVGIAPHDLGHLFERFYRAEGSRGRSFEGSGIGLSLVRELVELHGGRVDVTSAVDRGTTVSVHLPGGRAHLDTAQVHTDGDDVSARTADDFVAEALQWIEAAPEAPTRTDIQRPLVLVADDNADMRRYFRRALSANFRVVTTARGEEALAAARVERPDVIVTDVMMPGMDGFELLAAVRADPSLAGVPVIVVSARAGEEASVRGLAAGADDYLVKPFSTRELVERVNAQLRIAERASAAGAAAARHERRAHGFHVVSAALADATTLTETLYALDEARPLLGHARICVALLDKHYGILRLHHHGGAMPLDVVERNHNQPADADMPYARTVLDNDTVRIEDWRRESRYASAAGDAVRAGYLAEVSTPLCDLAGEPFGALGFAWVDARVFTDEELDDIAAIAAMVARTIDRIRHSEREHEIANVLQDDLLDVELRSTSAVACSRYLASVEMLRVGGDWYTATALGGGRVGVSVGDVVGSGVRAAAVMSQLRSALSAAALAAERPAAVLDIVNRHAATIAGAACTTAAYALIDAPSRRAWYTCAAHPYPLLIKPDGEVEFLLDGREGPLGCKRGRSSEGMCDFPPGALLLLYTDGLVERRGEAFDDGLARLHETARRCALLPANLVCDTIIAELGPAGGFTDDVALVAVRPVGTTPQSYVDSVDADMREYPPARRRFRTWLAEVGIDRATCHDVVLALGEALVNAIEHGSRATESAHVVALEAFVHADELIVSVSDGGEWNTDTTASRRAGARGRGLTLMSGLMDDVDIRRTRQGTSVVMRRTLARTLARS